MNSKEIIKKLEKDGWFLDRVRGSHHHFIHPEKSGIVTVIHPKKDIAIGEPAPENSWLFATNFSK
jgi:predicted RNA binding protein YcfA (HicA-like mRNA interferase family)